MAFLTKTGELVYGIYIWDYMGLYGIIWDYWYTIGIWDYMGLTICHIQLVYCMG